MDGLSRADIAGWNKTASKRARTRHVCLARTRRRNDSCVSFMFFFPVQVTAFLRVMTLKNVRISRARFSHERRIRYVRISTARTTCHTDSIAWNMRRADVTRRLTHASTTTAANERANHHRLDFCTCGALARILGIPSARNETSFMRLERFVHSTCTFLHCFARLQVTR